MSKLPSAKEQMLERFATHQSRFCFSIADGECLLGFAGEFEVVETPHGHVAIMKMVDPNMVMVLQSLCEDVLMTNDDRHKQDKDLS